MAPRGPFRHTLHAARFFAAQLPVDDTTSCQEFTLQRERRSRARRTAGANEQTYAETELMREPAINTQTNFHR
eukprot:1203663-Pyramimonas_sp.AAC.1